MKCDQHEGGEGTFQRQRDMSSLRALLCLDKGVRLHFCALSSIENGPSLARSHPRVVLRAEVMLRYCWWLAWLSSTTGSHHLASAQHACHSPALSFVPADSMRLALALGLVITVTCRIL